MRRGMGIFGLLFTGVLLYVTAMHAAGIMVQYPASQTVCRITDPTPQETISFPFAIEGTSLIAERVICYEGPDVEQNSQEPVSNTLALLIHNPETTPVYAVEVTLQSGENSYSFCGGYLPGQSRMLLVETGGAVWTTDPFFRCSGIAEPFAENPLEPGVLGLEDVDMGTVAVTNTGGEAMEGIRLYYKNYLPGTDIYLGGITYAVEVEALTPGQTVYLQPSRYASGYSRIVLAQAK